MEKPSYFDGGNGKLFGVLHTPERRAGKKGVIFLHPYAEEKQRVDRILVGLARLLCANGYFAMRFDFFGCGDSEGNFEEMSRETQMSDLERAKKVFLETTGVEEVTLFGVRLGSNIAAQYAGIDPEIRNVILWSPIPDGSEYAETLLRNKIFSGFLDRRNRASKDQLMAELQQNGQIDVDGFYLTKRYYEYLSTMTSIAEGSAFHCDAFVGLTNAEGRTVETYDAFADRFRERGKTCTIFTSEDRLYWDQRAHYQLYSPEHLREATVKWIASR